MKVFSKIYPYLSLYASELSILISAIGLSTQLYLQLKAPLISLPLNEMALYVIAFLFSVLLRGTYQALSLTRYKMDIRGLIIKQIIYTSLLGGVFWYIDGLFGNWLGILLTSTLVALWAISGLFNVLCYKIQESYLPPLKYSLFSDRLGTCLFKWLAGKIIEKPKSIF